MISIVQQNELLKEKDSAMTQLFDNLSTIISLNKLQLQKLIITTQAIAANIEARAKKSLMRYVRLLDFIEQYKEEEEARVMVDLDYQILRKNFIEIKSKIDSILNARGLSQSSKLAIDILKSYDEV